MSDEENFYRALINAGNYTNIDSEYRIKHPSEPENFILLDNVCQRDNTLFIFEGKTGKPEKAFGQLRKAYLSLSDPIHKRVVVYNNDFNIYSKIRLFYYSFRRGLLIEYSNNIKELNQYRFRDLGELSILLRNL